MTQSDDIGREAQRLIERVMGRLQLRMHQALVAASPVDTGFFRSRWQPVTGRLPSPEDRPTPRVVAVASAVAALSKNRTVAQALASGYRLSMGPVRVVNPTTYGPFLNQGSSAQAPARFVERAVLSAIRATAREVR